MLEVVCFSIRNPREVFFNYAYYINIALQKVVNNIGA